MVNIYVNDTADDPWKKPAQIVNSQDLAEKAKTLRARIAVEKIETMK